MQFKRYEPQNLTQMLRLFCDTVHCVNAADYSPEQQEAWAPYSVIDDPETRERWNRTLLAHLSLVAWEQDSIAGFADIDLAEGYLDRMYVSKDFQRQGVATALLSQLDQAAKDAGCKKITSDVSITARPFFEKNGFRVIRRQEVVRRDVTLVNFKMEKELSV